MCVVHTCEGHAARRSLAKRTDGSSRARERVANRMSLTNSHGKQVDKQTHIARKESAVSMFG